jgi:hypothetical protein
MPRQLHSRLGLHKGVQLLMKTTKEMLNYIRVEKWELENIKLLVKWIEKPYVLRRVYPSYLTTALRILKEVIIASEAQ